LDHSLDRLTRREERLLRDAGNRRRRKREPVFLAEGLRVNRDLVEADWPLRLVAALSTFWDSREGSWLLGRLARLQVPARILSEEELALFADTDTPQPVLAVAEIREHGVERLRGGEPPVVALVLDGIQDPGNLGTLARTAEALGARALVCLPGTTDPWGAKAVRAAAGATFRLPVIRTDWEELAPVLAAEGYRVLAADAGGDRLDHSPNRTALVMGNEGAGIGAETRARADQLVGIPMRGRAESLNVAGAAAILLHQLLR